MDTRASLEADILEVAGAIPEAEADIPVAVGMAEAGDSLASRAQQIRPFLTAYKINSARLCRFSFS